MSCHGCWLYTVNWGRIFFFGAFLVKYSTRVAKMKVSVKIPRTLLSRTDEQDGDNVHHASVVGEVCEALEFMLNF